MCGIAGIVSRFPTVHENIKLMLTSLRHRGPDDEGIFTCQDVTLGQRRLSIVDPEKGHQPLHHQSLSLVVNGEIYNYIELKKNFSPDLFKTGSDCEPLLFLYQNQGVHFLQKVRGMYALALYDAEKQELILARDPFGIKPLYYTQTDEGFFFASEIQALLQLKGVSRHISLSKAEELLQLRFTLGDKTIFPHIFRVLPGEILRIFKGTIIDRLQNSGNPFSYSRSLSKEEATDILEKELKESVDLHVRGDAPYGLFLSGGVDSSTLLALMHERGPVRTYTTAFPGCSQDESKVASRLAQAVQSEHTEVPFEEKDFWELLPRVVSCADDPYLDYTAVPLYKMAQVARQDVKVILSGEGADEFLGGYRRYRKIGWWIGRSPLVRSRGNFSDTSLLRNNSSNWKMDLGQELRPFLKSFYTSLQAAQGVDCKTWLPNTLLMRLDRCLMTHGIEGRTPFLDLHLSSFLFSLPDKLKIRHGWQKWILRDWLKKNFVHAPAFSKKQGFTYPAEQWILSHGEELGPLVARQPGIQELCRPEAVQHLFKQRDTKNGYRAWSLLFYALWHHKHVLNQPLEGSVKDILG